LRNKLGLGGGTLRHFKNFFSPLKNCVSNFKDPYQLHQLPFQSQTGAARQTLTYRVTPTLTLRSHVCRPMPELPMTRRVLSRHSRHEMEQPVKKRIDMP